MLALGLRHGVCQKGGRPRPRGRGGPGDFFHSEAGGPAVEWEGREESSNVEDRRGLGGRTGLAVGGGIGGLIVTLIAVFLGVNPQALSGLLGTGQQASAPADPEE